MSVKPKGVVALLLLGYFGACAYFGALDRCFESGGGWRRFSGCYYAERPTEPQRQTPTDADANAPAVLPGAEPGRELRRGQVVVRLVDSTHWRVEEGLDLEGDLWRIEIDHRGRLDTVPDIWVGRLPVLLSDSEITGVSYVEGDLRNGFRYLIGARRLDTIPLVGEIGSNWITPELSPNGRLIAYWALKGDGVGRIEIADWPGQGSTRTGPTQVVGGGDASPGFAHWRSADTLEYTIWVEEGKILKGWWTPSGFSPVDTTQGN